MTMQSEFSQIAGKGGRSAATNEVPKLGTVAECQIRAWFSI